MKLTRREIQNRSTIKALIEARKIKGVSRNEVAKRLNISYKAIEKYENGREIISDEKVQKIMSALEISEKDLIKLKKGKSIISRKRVKKVQSNIDRRSYKRIITKECQVLRSMRRMKKLSQDEASKICGYSRATIGHIENGRIELSKERIEHIIKCYGFITNDFDEHCNKAEFRSDLIEYCINKIEELDNNKLNLIKGVLASM